jgi:hypothetical protein
MRKIIKSVLKWVIGVTAFIVFIFLFLILIEDDVTFQEMLPVCGFVILCMIPITVFICLFNYYRLKSINQRHPWQWRERGLKGPWKID